MHSHQNRYRTLLVTTALLLFPFSSHADSFPKIIQKIKPAIVGIGTYNHKQKPMAQLYGSGFIIQPDGLIVTANHVLQAIDHNLQKDHLRVFLNDRNNPRGFDAKVVLQSNPYDIALLRCKETNLPFLKLGDGAKCQEGDEVAFCGYPYGMILGLYPTTHKGIISSISPHILPAFSTAELTPAILRALATKYNIFHLDAVIYPGHSGGPLIDPKSGAVIGIVFSGLFEKEAKTKFRLPTGISYAIPVEHIKTILEGVKSTVE